MEHKKLDSYDDGGLMVYSGELTKEQLKKRESRDYIKKWNEENYLCFSLLQVNLIELNDKPINENIDAAFEIIKGAYHNVLLNDPNWHFFYEGSYNIIRCSKAYYLDLLSYLDECGVLYEEKGNWSDEQLTTLKNQRVFMQMFHSFSLMAVSSNYNKYDILQLSDRVMHCFLNNQFPYIHKHVMDQYGSMWESNITCKIAYWRAHYIGRCEGIIELRNALKDDEKTMNKEREKLNNDIKKYNVNIGFTDSIWYKIYNFFNGGGKNNETE